MISQWIIYQKLSISFIWLYDLQEMLLTCLTKFANKECSRQELPIFYSLRIKYLPSPINQRIQLCDTFSYLILHFPKITVCEDNNYHFG